MKIKSVQARWIHVPIPTEQQHVSDFGRITAFDSTLVRLETDCGIVGYGEAKEEVGSEGNCSALALLINGKFAPLLIGEDPRDISRLWERMYNGVRAHYALDRGRVFPLLGRRGITVSADFILEYSLGANPLLHDLVEESFPVEDGTLEIPDRPGLGITVNPDFVNRYAVG